MFSPYYKFKISQIIMESYYLKYLKYKSKYLNLLNVLKGGEEIGPKVFRPPLHCNPRNAEFESTEYVGKILSVEDGTAELAKSNIVRRIDPSGSWSITMDYSCTIAEVQEDTDYRAEYYISHPMQLISRFGGITLKKVIGYDENDLRKLNCSNASLFIRLVKRSIISIDTLNAAGYRHDDLHLGNILYNESTESIKLMDFGKLIANDGQSDFENYHGFINEALAACKNQLNSPELTEWLRLPRPADRDTTDFRALILSLPDL